MSVIFDLDCKRCPRLSQFLDSVKSKHPNYHCRPVSPFGDPEARLLIVGLAPGMHGANQTGRPFTGDHAGILLYETLYQAGFSNAPTSSHINDGLELKNCRITNAVKCLPPQNKPTGDEVKNCAPFLMHEIDSLPPQSVVLALGKIAHDAVLRVLGMKLSAHPFGHGAKHPISDSIVLIDSYHCSRYNTQTRRLTTQMFRDVFQLASEVLSERV